MQRHNPNEVPSLLLKRQSRTHYCHFSWSSVSVWEEGSQQLIEIQHHNGFTEMHAPELSSQKPDNSQQTHLEKGSQKITARQLMPLLSGLHTHLQSWEALPHSRKTAMQKFSCNKHQKHTQRFHVVSKASLKHCLKVTYFNSTCY